ncbi:MAG: cytochrome c [Gammaproteobacteria bacterium]|nr:cytochrome c [Gammaproteobacteria bacterium]
MKKWQLILITLILPLLATVASAGDPAAGKAKAATCAGCHGPNGISTNPLWPNLAGQHAQYLVKQMKAFRDGERNDPLMSPMSTGLTDEDIENLAAYYASLNPGG